MANFIFQILILLFSITIHEVAHGAMAERLGDPTARMAGRISLNPLKHLDPVGSFLLPLFMLLAGLRPIGWAKPVPINPFNFRDQKYGQAKAALAGPAANIGLAVVFGLLIRFAPWTAGSFSQNMAMFFSYIVLLNLLLAVFNLLPLPPLDGSHILFTFLPRQFDRFKFFLQRYGFFFLIFFLFFLFPLILPVVGWLFQLITGIVF